MNTCTFLSSSSVYLSGRPCINFRNHLYHGLSTPLKETIHLVSIGAGASSAAGSTITYVSAAEGTSVHIKANPQTATTPPPEP